MKKNIIVNDKPWDLKYVLNEVKYIKNEIELNLIKNAYHYAKKWHDGQFRQSGEAYISHPVAVAIILGKIKANHLMICMGLLHDVLEDTKAPAEEIKSLFGEQVANGVEVLTKITKETEVEEGDVKNKGLSADYLQKLIIGMAGDPQVIVVKLADRLHNMRTLGFKKPTSQQRISQETLDVFVPIASMLGYYNIKAELEDICFKHLHPEEYRKIERLISDSKIASQAHFDILVADVEKDLEPLKKKIVSVEGRIKQKYSIYKKMISEKKRFTEILDLVALRIVTINSISCYEALGILHRKYTPLPNRFKDFIATPKENLYQALHSTIIIKGETVEVQLRDKEMDELARFGTASHFIYKNEVTDKDEKFSENALNFINNIRRQIEQAKTVEGKKQRLIADIVHDIFQTNISILDKEGNIHQLPKGATVLDLAFAMSDEIGAHAVSALVNGKPYRLNETVNQGDMVEIITNPSVVLTSASLSLATTQYAKDAIRKNVMDHLIQKTEMEHTFTAAFAKEIINNFLERNPKWIKVLTSQKELTEIASLVGLDNVEALFEGIASRDYEIPDLVHKYRNSVFGKKLEVVTHITNRAHQIALDIKPLSFFKEDTTFDTCAICSPVFGDEIVINPPKSVVKLKEISQFIIHRPMCRSIERTKKDIYKLEWTPEKTSSLLYDSFLIIELYNRKNSLLKILRMFSVFSDVDIFQLTAKALSDKSFGKITIGMSIKSMNEVQEIIQTLNTNDDVLSVERLIEEKDRNELS